MSITLNTLRSSGKASFHQRVMAGKIAVDSEWREQVDTVVCKVAESRRTARRWHWLSRGESGGTRGRGARAALLFGPSYGSGNEAAVGELVTAQPGGAA